MMVFTSYPLGVFHDLDFDEIDVISNPKSLKSISKKTSMGFVAWEHESSRGADNIDIKNGLGVAESGNPGASCNLQYETSDIT